jgi:hypothetical protein
MSIDGRQVQPARRSYYVTIIEALELALDFVDTFLVAEVTTGDPIRDDLALAINRIKTKYPAIASEEL